MSDTWVYDKTHPDGNNTIKTDKNFKPTESDLPVKEQRRLSETHHKDEQPKSMVSLTPEDAGQTPEKVLQRRRSSVSSQSSLNRRGSRKATGSFGGGSGMQPLTSLSSEEKDKVLNSTSNPLYFSEGLAGSK